MINHWWRDAVELAALFVAFVAADLFASAVGHKADGPVALSAMAAVLVGGVAVHKWWVHRPFRGPGASPAGEAVLWRLRTTVRDTPGRLAAVCAALAERGVNILAVQVHPLPDAVTDEFLVAAPPGITAADLTVAVGCGGGTGTRVVRADPHELGDVPTRVLHLAARAGAGSADLPAVLGDLFSGAEVRHLPGSAVEEYAGETIRLRDPDGRVLAVTRPDLPFTPAEFARARALVGCAPPASDFARLADVTATGEDG